LANGSPTTENSINLFDPALAGMTDFAGGFALANLSGCAAQPQESHLLLLGQVDGRLVTIDRTGTIGSTLNIALTPGDTLGVAQQQHAATLRAEADLVTAQAEARLLNAATEAVRADTRAAHGAGQWFPVVFAAMFGCVSGALPLALLVFYVISVRRDAAMERSTLEKIARRMDDGN
jgi:hypothetical protein